MFIYTLKARFAARSKKTVDVSNDQAKASATSMEPVRLTIGEATALAKERVPWWMFAKGRVWFGVNDIYIYMYRIYPSTGLFLMWYDSSIAAAILQLFRVFPWWDFQLGNPPKSQKFWAGRRTICSNLLILFKYKGSGGRDPQVFQKRWSNLKNQRIFQSLSDQHPFKVNPSGQEIHGLRFNLREMFFLVGSHQNPLTQSRQRWLRA